MLQQLILLLGHAQGTIKAHCASEEAWGGPGAETADPVLLCAAPSRTTLLQREASVSC